MSDASRGAYAPESDAPLVFDARKSQSAQSPMPMALVISVVVLVVLGGAILYLYRSGARSGTDIPRPVGTSVAETRGAPAGQAAPAADPAVDIQVYNPQKPDLTGQAAFAAPPEKPQPRGQGQPISADHANSGLRPSQPAVATVRAEDSPIATAPSLSAARLIVAPPVVIKVPAEAATRSPPPVPKVAEAPPRPAPAAIKVAAPPAKPVAHAAISRGTARVQIGAYSSKALADRGWNDAARIAPASAAGKGKTVEAIQKGDVTLFRTSVTGFASKADAAAFCADLKAAGKDCFVK